MRLLMYPLDGIIMKMAHDLFSFVDDFYYIWFIILDGWYFLGWGVIKDKRRLRRWCLE